MAPPVEAIDLTWAEILHGAMAGVYRQVQNLKMRRQNANGAEEEDPWRIHINGCLAEVAVAKWLGRYWDGMGALGDLTASDVRGAVQVRWVAKPTYRLIIQPKDPDLDMMVLVSGQAPRYVLHGWIQAQDGKRDEFWDDPKGGRPAWFVPQSALHPMTT